MTRVAYLLESVDLCEVLPLHGEQLANVPLLVAAPLEEGRGPHLEAQDERVKGCVEVASLASKSSRKNRL